MTTHVIEMGELAFPANIMLQVEVRGAPGLFHTLNADFIELRYPGVGKFFFFPWPALKQWFLDHMGVVQEDFWGYSATAVIVRAPTWRLMADVQGARMGRLV